MIPQCKGKDYLNLPKTLNYPLDASDWSYSTKYDGHYIQIVKVANSVTFYTSKGKPFYIANIERALIELNTHDFVIECEYIADTDGSLGSRTKCSTATFRANSSKGITNYTEHTFKVFNTISGLPPKLPPQLQYVSWSDPTSLTEAFKVASIAFKAGSEGLMLKHTSHVNMPGKRVNTLVKLKHRPTADLLCVGTTEGDGEFTGGIGALVLKDKSGLTVQVSSGLSIEERFLPPSTYIGQIIEMQYEQILDTYIQPVYVCIRDDKSQGDN